MSTTTTIKRYPTIRGRVQDKPGQDPITLGIRKVVKEVKDFAQNKASWQKQPPEGKTYLRGQLVKRYKKPSTYQVPVYRKPVNQPKATYKMSKIPSNGKGVGY